VPGRYPDAELVEASRSRVVLMDFGIAHAAAGTQLTRAGTVIGTPEYMSPEQADGRQVDARTDLYSLGVVMYECLTGRVPFTGDNAASIIYRLVHEQPDNTPFNFIPKGVKALTMSLLSKNPDHRPATAAKSSEAIRLLQQGKEWQPPTRPTQQTEPERPTIKVSQAKPPAKQFEPRIQPHKSKKQVSPAVWVLGVIALVLVIILVNHQANQRQEAERKRQLIEQRQREQQEAERQKQLTEQRQREQQEAERQRQLTEQRQREQQEAERQKQLTEQRQREQQEAERQRQLAEQRQREQQEAERQRQLTEQRQREQQEAARRADPFHDQMVFVKGGTFTMGCTSEQGSDCYDNEKPTRRVTVSDFYIGKYEVTVLQFKQFIDDTNYRTDADKSGSSWIWTGSTWAEKSGVNWKCDVNGNTRPQSDYSHPVIHVSWNDAVEFSKWLSRKTGKKYRLPTEAEWEYAARGGAQSRGFKYAGSNNIDEVAWYSSNSGSKTRPVGGKKANELGLFDMSGNVWEWCEDDWHGNYKGAPTNGRAWIDSPRGTPRVMRGGSWGNGPRDCRVSIRDFFTPGDRSSIIGFRLSRMD
jgi:formylglycine-generating enzyme required for sulfatase activity